jgi:T-complex protein 1 subunit alpha
LPLSLSFSFSFPLAGEIRNNLEAGVVEPAISKIKSLRFACEAAIAILRIDDMVKLNVHKQER